MSPVTSLIEFCAISIMVKLRKPKKSNFTKPACSTSSLSNMDTGDVSSPCAWYTGQKSVSLPGAINTPPACMPTPRVKSSSFCANTINSSASSASMISAICGSASMAFFKPNGLFCSNGINLDKRSHRLKGKSNTRPTSRITALDDSVPNVTIWLTASWP